MSETATWLTALCELLQVGALLLGSVQLQRREAVLPESSQLVGVDGGGNGAIAN